MGLQSTGRLITSAALIMVGVFGGFAAADWPTCTSSASAWRPPSSSTQPSPNDPRPGLDGPARQPQLVPAGLAQLAPEIRSTERRLGSCLNRTLETPMVSSWNRHSPTEHPLRLTPNR